ncbi:ATP-binding protein [Sphingomonas sp. KR3-1]|uniref:sensor histidine kinase n=1 Tax=Sphingomonas sp. KR3-1 TaxID=3156611 RepID=UPI0032B604BD
MIDRHAAAEDELIPPAQAIAAIAPLLILAAGPLVDLGFDLPDDLPAVACEIHAFENAVFNLVTHARGTMPEGGVLLLALARQGQAVLLHAIDDGPGMSAATMAFAFAPGFALDGHGLGLAAVRRFAERSGGWTEIDSAPGNGTTVTIGLPAAT